MPLTVLRVAEGGPANLDGRLKVSYVAKIAYISFLSSIKRWLSDLGESAGGSDSR